jgi:hypothetical protein
MNEFDDVIHLLKDERPQATELELDAIKQRVLRNAERPSRRNQPMKSRLAILGMLVFGMLFSTAGAGLAISGVSQSGTNAAISQYATSTATPTPTPDGNGGVLPAEEENAPSDDEGTNGGNDNGGGTSPGADSDVAGATDTQDTAQQGVSARTSQLPFTGFAAVPVLVGGLALLSGGLVLRRRTHSE